MSLQGRRYYYDRPSLVPTKPGVRRIFRVTRCRSGSVEIRFEDNGARSAMTEAQLAACEAVPEPEEV